MLQNRSARLTIFFGLLMFFLKCEFIDGANNECVDCTAHRGRCKMTTTGWAPFRHSTKDASIVAKLPSYTDGDPNLARCVLDGYYINGQIETFICFWAPYMGCQAVARSDIINKHHMHPIVCKTCAKYCGCYLGTKSKTEL